MRRGWLAVALLASSGLLSAGYFDPPRPVIAVLAVLLAAVLLRVVRCDWPAPRSLSLGLALLLPAVWFWPWPSVLIAWLLILAALIELLDAGPAWLRQIGARVGRGGGRSLGPTCGARSLCAVDRAVTSCRPG